MSKLTIADLNEFVANIKGACLSKEYIDTMSMYKWRCVKGHTFDMTLSSVRKGAWCTMCRRSSTMEEYIETCKAYAKARNGELLSKSLVNKKAISTWRCAHGHEWSTCTSTMMSKKTWCAFCANAFTDINLVHELAAKKGGKCLSTSIYGVHSIIKLECAEGHQWETKFSLLKYASSWCKICSLNANRHTNRIPYSEVVKKLRSIKIEILTPEKKYHSQQQEVSMICSQGHKWKNTIQRTLFYKRGCPVCNPIRVTKKHSLKEMKSLAAQFGGECLSKKYQHTIMLDWKCSQNHIFKKTSTSVRKGKWCPRCSGIMPHGIEDFIRIAKSHKGKCLSTEYKSNSTLMKFQCEKGHTWQSKARNVLKGYWCPECRTVKPYTIDDFKKYAFRNKGECLSTEYNQDKSPIIFKCHQGHIWKSDRKCIILKTWCLACSPKRFSDKEIMGLFKPGIEDMKILAREMKGECKSGYFISIDSPLRWKCKKGHEWKASYNFVRTGSWCPQCAEFKKIQSYNAEMLSIIRFKKGKLLSLKIGEKVNVMCKNGHTFSALKNKIRIGYWCKACGETPLVNYQMAVDHATANNGICLTTKEQIKSEQTMVSWRCSRGHEWKRQLQIVVATKTWCPQCG